MNSSTSSSESRRPALIVAAGLLIAAVITVVIQSLVSHYRPAWESVAGAVYRLQLAQVEAASEESLILGDSRALRGLDPRTLEARLGDGSTWRNLSLNGMPPLGAHLLLRRRVAERGPPARVIYAITPFLLADDEILEAMFLELFPLRLSEVGVVLTAPIARQAKYHWLLASIFPILRQEGHLRSQLGVFAFKPERRTAMVKKEIARIQAELLAAGGFIPKTLTMPPRHKEEVEKVRAAQRFQVLPIHQAHVEELCRYAAEIGTQLHVVTPPLPAALNGIRRESGFNADYAAWLTGLAETCPQLRIKEPTVPDYPPELFADPDHLREIGAKRYTAEVADWLGGIAPPIGVEDEHHADSGLIDAGESFR